MNGCFLFLSVDNNFEWAIVGTQFSSKCYEGLSGFANISPL